MIKTPEKLHPAQYSPPVHTRWLSVPNPSGFALEVLRRQAPDIPEHLITARPWHQHELPLDAIHPDRAMIERHDNNPRHVRRRDNFVAAIRAGQELPPLIVLNHHLVDGYARYRALVLLDIAQAQALTQIGLTPSTGR